MTYRERPERFVIAEKREKRVRVCATDRQRYRLLRLNPCVEYFALAEEVEPIRNSKDVDTLIHETYDVGSKTQESLWVLCVDTRNRPLGIAEMFRGGRSDATVDRALLFQAALLVGSGAFIIAHNHPSEEAVPSDEDVAMTNLLAKGAKDVGLRLLDHLIVTRRTGRYFSFADSGLLGG